MKMLSPMEFAIKHEIPYSTVMRWLNTGRIRGAEPVYVARRAYWQIPSRAKRPIVKRGAPRKQRKTK